MKILSTFIEESSEIKISFNIIFFNNSEDS